MSYLLANGETEPRKRRGDFRQTILDATRRIIDERGLQAATTRNIAELAGCAEGTIYRHFEDKHELFLELFAGSSPEFLISSLFCRLRPAAHRSGKPSPGWAGPRCISTERSCPS